MTQEAIHSIDSNAFNFDKHSDKKLVIEFNDCHINGSAFAEYSFNGTKTETVLVFNNTIGTSQLKYLDEKVFENFMNDVDELNQIYLVNNELDCEDCKNVWLRKHMKLQSKIKPLKCSNGLDFNAFDTFNKCHK